MKVNAQADAQSEQGRLCPMRRGIQSLQPQQNQRSALATFIYRFVFNLLEIEQMEIATDRKIKTLLASRQFSALRSAGYSVSDVLSAGYSASDVQALEDSIPLIEKPYSRIWSGIQAQTIKHDQSTFGPDADPKTNLCKTQMCTAGHLVNMGGAQGYALKEKYDFATAAALIHYKSHPGWPSQEFGNIPQDWALAYIEEMAEHEANGTSPVVAATA